MDPPEYKASTSDEEVTIIRIKRKRSEDVPDMLVVDDKGTKRRKSGGVNVFRFAETVDEAEWKEMKGHELRSRISALSKSGQKAGNEKEDEGSPLSPVAGKKRQRSTTHTTARGRKYRVIARQPERRSRSNPTPPKVKSSKDVEKTKSGIRIYDAELASPPTSTETKLDPEMEKFQELLQDYLKVYNDLPSLPPLSSKSLTSTATSASTNNASPQRIAPTTPGGEYVYDIFFYFPSSSTGSHQVLVPAGNVATIIGLPPGFDLDEEFEDESEVEDEADEDSNAEDYYKNDYPDEESSDESTGGSDLWSEDEYDHSGRFEPD